MEYKLTIDHALECARLRFVMVSIGMKFELAVESKANEDLCTVPETIHVVVSARLEMMRTEPRPCPAQVET